MYRISGSHESQAGGRNRGPVTPYPRNVSRVAAADGATGGASSIEASGVLNSAAGAVPIAFVFLQEPPGLRILVVSLGGVPVLQGVSPIRP